MLDSVTARSLFHQSGLWPVLRSACTARDPLSQEDVGEPGGLVLDEVMMTLILKLKTSSNN